MTVPLIIGRQDLYQGANTSQHWFQYMVNRGKVYRWVSYGDSVWTLEEPSPAPFSVAFKTPNTTTRVHCAFQVECGGGCAVKFIEGSTLVPDVAAKAKNRVIAGTSATLFDEFTGTAPAGTVLWAWQVTPAVPATFDGYMPRFNCNVIRESNLLLAANQTYAVSVYNSMGDDTTMSCNITIEIVEEVPAE